MSDVLRGDAPGFLEAPLLYDSFFLTRLSHRWGALPCNLRLCGILPRRSHPRPQWILPAFC